jgi:SAM-dependent methyltransferase
MTRTPLGIPLPAPLWGALRAVAGAVPGLPELYRRLSRRTPPVGRVRFGSLRRTSPISEEFGYDRGTPIDRYYIEGFLGRCAPDIRGRVLEVGDASYTRRFGGARVTQSDVLHVSAANPHATIVASLPDADHVPSDSFDCIVFTQTLHLVYDFHAAIRTLHRILRPGGVLLATVPGITPRDRGEWGAEWFWSFTEPAVRRMFGDVFTPAGVTVEAHGNVLAAGAFLQGLAVRELTPRELDVRDPAFDVIVAVRAVKR